MANVKWRNNATGEDFETPPEYAIIVTNVMIGGKNVIIQFNEYVPEVEEV